jgi:hypothetical protein
LLDFTFIDTYFFVSPLLCQGLDIMHRLRENGYCSCNKCTLRGKTKERERDGDGERDRRGNSTVHFFGEPGSSGSKMTAEWYQEALRRRVRRYLFVMLLPFIVPHV